MTLFSRPITDVCQVTLFSRAITDVCQVTLFSRAITEEPSFALAWQRMEERWRGSGQPDALLSQVSTRLKDRVAAAGVAGSARTASAASAPHGGVPTPGFHDGVLPLHPERVDPTWYTVSASGRPIPNTVAYRLALGALPEALGEAVCQAAGLPISAPLRHHPSLCRAAARGTWSHLVDMPPERPTEPRWPTGQEPAEALALGMPSLPSQAIHSAVVWAGVPTFGALMRHLPDRAAAGLCARFPNPLRKDLWRARRGPDDPHCTPAPPTRQELLRLHADLHQADPARLLFSLGARHWAAFLRPHGARPLCAVAQALTLPAGRLLLEAPPCEPPLLPVLMRALMRE